jgi:hypothetical protein
MPDSWQRVLSGLALGCTALLTAGFDVILLFGLALAEGLTVAERAQAHQTLILLALGCLAALVGLSGVLSRVRLLAAAGGIGVSSCGMIVLLDWLRSDPTIDSTIIDETALVPLGCAILGGLLALWAALKPRPTACELVSHTS